MLAHFLQSEGMTVFKIPVRLIIAVGVGIVASKVLDILTHWLLHLAGWLPPVTKPNFSVHNQVLLLCFHSAFTIVSAFLTALIARNQVKKAIFILGTKEAVFWLIGMVLLWNHSPFWVNMAKAVLG